MPLRVHLHNKPVWRFIFGKSWENNLALPLIEGTTSTRVTSPSGGGGSVDDDDRRTAPHRASTSPPERHTTGEGVVCFTQGCSCSSSSTRRSYVDPPSPPLLCRYQAHKCRVPINPIRSSDKWRARQHPGAEKKVREAR